MAMVSIYLCGACGAGKNALAKELLKKKPLRDSAKILGVPREILKQHNVETKEQLLENKDSFYKLQEFVIEEQCRREEKHRKERVLSDHCVLDSLVSTWFNIEESAARVLVADHPKIKDSFGRYQSSLLVLLSTLPVFEDDGIRIRLPKEDCKAVVSFYRSFCDQYRIPMFDLTTRSDMDERVQAIADAVQGKVLLPTSSLNHYSLMSKGKCRAALEGYTGHFSFFKTRPKASQSVSVPTIKMTEHRAEQDWTTFQKGTENRFIARYGVANLMILSFDECVKSTVVQKTLLSGVTVNGQAYSFLGCSSSGLKNRKCYMWKGSKEEATEIIKANGNFDNMTVSKKLARIGLLFSKLQLTHISVKNENIKMVDDIKCTQSSDCFTDGCGGIGTRLAKNIFEELENSDVIGNYLPSVYQIRLQGYKGVLSIDPTLSKDEIMVRPSMKKFESSEHERIGICGYSLPHVFGHLNRQFIMLLSGLGVPDTVFKEKQRIYLEMLKEMGTDPKKAIIILQWQNMFDVAQRLIKHLDPSVGAEHISSLSRDQMKYIFKVQSKLISELNRPEKLRILIYQSRNIYGVSDQTGLLNYGECFLRVTCGNIGYPRTIRGHILVGKNPCYLLGDLRVLRAVDSTDRPGLEQINHLVDCIVFPTCGVRPHPNEIAGSDLDGDQYFVTWDPDLIPPHTKPPYSYPGAFVKDQGNVTFEKCIQYFAKQNETKKMTARIDRNFRLWANKKGIDSDECERLGMLFARAIDSAKTGEDVEIPRNLVIYDNDCESKYIWQLLENTAKNFALTLQEKVVRHEDGFPTCADVDEQFVQEIVKQDISNISEFEKFQFAWNKTQALTNDEQETAQTILDNYAGGINFSLFSMDEKREAFRLGISVDLVANALNKSRLLSSDDLKEFGMHTAASTWKFYFRDDHSHFNWMYLLKAVTHHDRSLIVMQLPDGVTLVLLFLARCSLGLEQEVSPGTILGFLYSKNFSYRKKYVLGPRYLFDLTEETFQLYRQLKNLTFVSFRRTDYNPKHTEDRHCNETTYPVSINLLRFDKQILQKNHPLVNKVPFISMEVFVQNESADVPYFDSVEANDIEPVPEIDEFESVEDIDTETDFSDLLSEYNARIESCTDEGQLKNLLQESVTGAKPIMFYNILKDWLQKQPNDRNPLFVTDLTISLLEVVVVNTVPCLQDLPAPLRGAVEYLLHICVISDPLKLLEVAKLLSMLKCTDLMVEVMIRNLESCVFDIQTFLHALKLWHVWWFLDKDNAKQIICNIENNLSEAYLTQKTLSQEELTIGKYIIYFVKLNVFELLQEMGSLKDRMQNENKELSISNMKIERPSEDEPEIITFYRASALSSRPKINKGQFVAVTRQSDFQKSQSHLSCCCLGQVESILIAPLTVTVKILGEFPFIMKESLRAEKSRLWKIDLIANITTFDRVMNAYENLSSLDKPLPPLLSMLIHPGGHPKESLLYENVKIDEDLLGHFGSQELDSSSRLNFNQQKAVQTALQRTLTLIQGPPGTGKTTVACGIVERMVERMVKEGHEKILVVAETNVAVDNLVKKLRQALPLDIIRLGTDEGVDREVFDLTLEGQLKMMEETEAKKTSYRDEQGKLRRKPRLVKKILENARVVLTTCAGAGDFNLEPYKFEFVLVDEATQTKETTLLCSLMHGAKQLVMIGDPKQLGPVTVLDKDEVNIDGIGEMNVLSTTLFHRFFEVLPCCFLDTQYRMHPELMEFPSTVFYDGQLKSGVKSTSCLPVEFPWPNKHKPLCFIDVQGKETKIGKSFYNIGEIEIIQKILFMLLNVSDEKMYKPANRLNVTDIGILALYQGQVKKLKEKTKTNSEIRSIDGFQGREKEVIIVSTVRANTHGSLGFSDDRHRMNVLLTRAKRGLIIVGNENTLNASDLWKSWLKDAPIIDKHNIEEQFILMEQEIMQENAFGAKRPQSNIITGNRSRGHQRLATSRSHSNRGRFHSSQSDDSSFRGHAQSSRGNLHSSQGAYSSFRGQAQSNRGYFHSSRGTDSFFRGQARSNRGHFHYSRGTDSSFQGQAQLNRGNFHCSRGTDSSARTQTRSAAGQSRSK